MNCDPELILELNEALEKKTLNLDKTVAPVLKEQFQLFQANYRAFFELLLQRGLIKPDPYKNERHLSDIRLPDEPPQNEMDMQDQLPILLSEYDNILDFLISYTPLDSGNLSLKKIKTLSGIIKYIDWPKINPNNTHLLPRALGELVEKIKGGNDQLSAQNVQSIQNRMDTQARELMKALKAMTDFKREEYKLALINKIVLNNPAFQSAMGKDDFLRLVKSSFPKAMEGEPFYPELVQELYSELYEMTPESYRNQALERFKVDETRKKHEATTKFNLKEILFDGMKNLGTSSRHLDEAIAKLQESNEMLKTRPKTLLEKFKYWIISLSQPKQKDETFEIELIDMYTSAKKIEKIQFNSYCNLVQRKARYLASFLVKTSATWVKLETAKEEELYDLLGRNVAELKTFHDTLDAIDTYFKTEAPPAERNKLKGIKVELGNIKNSIALVNQKMHEYIARKDEMEQLKKLGMHVEP